MEKNVYLNQVTLMNVNPESVSLRVRVYDTFATVCVNVNGADITLFVKDEDEARAVIKNFVMPTVQYHLADKTNA
jgi:hypothetical protein